TPLWPAGHLPRKGGDQQLRPTAFFRNIWRLAKAAATSNLSPCGGEMAGRPEGGVTELGLLKDGA
ncbi:MAG: hypothetical protein EOS38_30315, partial [Mesorhizobium sp.]